MRALFLIGFMLAPLALASVASDSGIRSPTASVVATASAYNGVTVVTFVSASVATGYSNQDAITVVNQGTATTTFAAAEQSDASNVASSVTTCSANTAVGASCVVKLSGPAKSAGTYGVTITMDGTASGSFSSHLPSIPVTVKYCILPPC